MTAYQRGEFEQAAEHLSELGRGDQGAVGLLSRFYASQAYYRLGLELFRHGQYGEAAQRFRAAAQMNPEAGSLGRFIVSCRIREQRLDVAAAEVESMLARQPGQESLRVQLAQIRWKQGNRIECASILNQGLEKHPESAELHYQLGLVLASEDRIADAQRYFERAAALNPRHAGALERLAQCCSLSNRHERALRYLERAHQIDPSNRRILWQISILAQAFGSEVQVAITETPEEWASRLEERDLERLSDAILAEPDFVEAILSVPESEVDSEVFSAMASILEKALQKRPEYADLHYHCGVVYRRIGQSQDAIRHAEEAVRINPRYVNALILLAQLYGQTDRLSAGIERLEQAIAAGGDYPDVHYLIGQLYQSSGDLHRARAAYERALDLNQQYQAARDALSSLAA